ncbi:hypothetical protein C8F01DRAFT_1259210 [Mycena amicta]|nr:hypothetical protein C8F01DRAFT_1259210 [Mycena amicta]
MQQKRRWQTIYAIREPIHIDPTTDTDDCRGIPGYVRRWSWACRSITRLSYVVILLLPIPYPCTTSLGPPGADPAPFEPKPLNGEVERFDFMDKEDIEVAMRAGRFKANFLTDLFIRLGYITPDNEPEYMKIVTGLHTQFDYERWVCVRPALSQGSISAEDICWVGRTGDQDWE